MTWCKLEAGIRTNGKIGEAGPDGALVFLALLTLHTDRGAAGVVPASCCRPARLRTEAVAFLGTFDPDRIEAGIDACVRAELCARRADGAIELRGWSDDHAVACSHCRKPNPEPSHKTCPDCRAARKADREPSKQAGARKTRAHGATRAQNGAAVSQMAALDSVSVSVSVSDIPPTPQGGRAHGARGANAARRPEPEPEPETRSAESPPGADAAPPPAPPPPAAERRRAPPDDGASPVADLTNALLATRYRAGIGNAIVRRGEVRARAAELVADGMDLELLAALVRLAEAKSNGDPGALLAHWLDAGGDWVGVLAEQGMKAKEGAARRRGAAAQRDDGDALDGIYGSDPKPAASVVGGVLAKAAGGEHG